jgi:hypothetical protein
MRVPDSDILFKWWDVGVEEKLYLAFCGTWCFFTRNSCSCRFGINVYYAFALTFFILGFGLMLTYVGFCDLETITLSGVVLV